MIAEKLKQTINQTRNIFYKFQQYNLVTFTSKKDRKKGWYIYFFTFNPVGAAGAFVRLKKEKITKLEQQLEKEKAHEFYVCPNKDMRATLENAMEHNFTCFECGQLLVPEDNAKGILRIEKEIEALKKEINDFENGK
jgi:transcription factor E